MTRQNKSSPFAHLLLTPGEDGRRSNGGQGSRDTRGFPVGRVKSPQIAGTKGAREADARPAARLREALDADGGLDLAYALVRVVLRLRGAA